MARVLAEQYPTSPTFNLLPSLFLAVTTGILFVLLQFVASAFRPLPDEKRDAGEAFPLVLPLVYVLWPEVAPRVGWTLLVGSLALSLLLFLQSGRGFRAGKRAVAYPMLVAIFLGVITFGLYLATLGPTVGQADTFEFQVVAPTLGIAHPTGYPLYILFGKLFSLLPFGSVAWRVNLTSAVFATLASVLLYYLILALTRRPLTALIPALALALSRVFWSQAVVAEVYALHNLFVVALLLLLLAGVEGHWRNRGWREDPAFGAATAAEKNRARFRFLFHPLNAIALLVGLSFANHLTTVLLLPAVALTMLLARPRLGGRGWLAAAGLLGLGLAVYLYIYVRWPMLHGGIWMSPAEFWRYITGQQFGGALHLDAWRTDPTRCRILLRLLREPFGWPALVLSAIGLGWLVARRWRVALLTGVTFLAYVWYGLSYYVPDVSVFLLPAHILLAAWMGVGMAAVLNLVSGVARRLQRGGKDGVGSWVQPLGGVMLVSLFAMLPLRLLWTNFPLVDQSGQTERYLWGERVLELPLDPEAAILADSVNIAPLYYLQRIEGRRPDLDILVLADEALYRSELERRVAAGQTVYLARFLPGLEGAYHLRSVGPLTEVSQVPLQEVPPLDLHLAVRFIAPAEGEVVGASVELLGLDGPAEGPAGGTGFTLFWRATEPLAEVYHVRLRVIDTDGQVWWQENGGHAANNYYPTPAWQPGEIVADYHEIPPLPYAPGTAPATYTLQVGLFRPFSEVGLQPEVGTAWYTLPPLPLALELQPLAPERPLRIRFGSGLLMGVDLPEAVRSAERFELGWHWAAPSGNQARQGQMALTWVAGDGGHQPPSVLEAWGAQRWMLQAPDAPGSYELRLSSVDAQDAAGALYCGWLARPSEACALAQVSVTEAGATALANFDGKMRLLSADLISTGTDPVPTLVPGQSLALEIMWQGVRPMQQDYTVSVQLIGPDGRLYGQTDAWPVQGTYPTSQWPPNEQISDPYEVVLSPDAPAGGYRVGVVVYLLATQTRLPVVNAGGEAIGDVAWVGEFEVVPR